MSDMALIVTGVFLIGFGAGGAAVRYVAQTQIRSWRALVRGLEREIYETQRKKAVLR